MADSKLTRLQDDLVKIPGVHSARVVGNDAPLEIHIVATSDRPAKQLVRDVQSLSAARHGLPIDHRIVSVVQLPDEPPPPPPPSVRANGTRPALERVVVATEGPSGSVKVGLRWPHGTTTEGEGTTGGSRETRAWGATNALLKALEPVLRSSQASIDVTHVLVHGTGAGDDFVVVRGVFYDPSGTTPVVGSAIVHDDVASAAVRALLQAINRKLA